MKAVTSIAGYAETVKVLAENPVLGQNRRMIAALRAAIKGPWEFTGSIGGAPDGSPRGFGAVGQTWKCESVEITDDNCFPLAIRVFLDGEWWKPVCITRSRPDGNGWYYCEVRCAWMNKPYRVKDYESLTLVPRTRKRE